MADFPDDYEDAVMAAQQRRPRTRGSFFPAANLRTVRFASGGTATAYMGNRMPPTPMQTFNLPSGGTATMPQSSLNIRQGTSPSIPSVFGGGTTSGQRSNELRTTFLPSGGTATAQISNPKPDRLMLQYRFPSGGTATVPFRSEVRQRQPMDRITLPSGGTVTIPSTSRTPTAYQPNLNPNPPPIEYMMPRRITDQYAH